MRYKAFDTYVLEAGEPVFRSCWECNPAHEGLKNTDVLHTCFVCGRAWIFGRYLDDFNTAAELDEFLKQWLKPVTE